MAWPLYANGFPMAANACLGASTQGKHRAKWRETTRMKIRRRSSAVRALGIPKFWNAMHDMDKGTKNMEYA